MSTLFFSSFCLCFSSSRALRFSAFNLCSSSLRLRSSSWLSLRRRAFSSFSNHCAFFAAASAHNNHTLAMCFRHSEAEKRFNDGHNTGAGFAFCHESAPDLGLA